MLTLSFKRTLSILVLSCVGVLVTSAQLPKVTNFLPASGPIGTNVTINGTNFNTTPVNNVVYFGAVKAEVTSSTTTKLVVKVPAGATFKPISVLNTASGLAAYTNKPFILTYNNTANGNGIPNNFYKPKVDFRTSNLPFSLTTSDLDLDGKPDIAVINQFSNSVSVLRNTTGSGNISSSSFASKTDWPTGSNPWCIVTEDVDGDGKEDIVVANNGHPSTISVLKNISTVGNVQFAPRVNFTCDYGPTCIAVSDIDNDGRPDLITSNRSGTISVLKNLTQKGTVTNNSFASKIDFKVGTNLRFVAVDDIDGDGRRDLVTTNEQSSFVSVLRNTSAQGIFNSSSFAPKVNFATDKNPVYVSVADLDDDGKPEIVTANAGSNSISVLHNGAVSGSINQGSFDSNFNLSSSVTPYCVTLADIDGDGKLDIVSTNTQRQTNSVSIYQNRFNGNNFNRGSFAPKVDFAVGNDPYAVAVGDLDGDGNPEQIVTGYNANVISILQSMY